MPTDYAEPKRLEGLKIEVLPNDSKVPLLVKEANSNIFVPAAEARGQLAVGSRNSSLGTVHNAPPRQSANLANDPSWKTIDAKNAIAYPSRGNQIRQALQDPTLPMGVTQADVEGTAVVGKFLVGAYDQLLGINPIGRDRNTRRTNQREVFTPLENIGYTAGRRVVHGGQVAVEDAVSSSKKILDDLWSKRPTFEIPVIEIPKITLPEIPQIKLPEIDLPEIHLPKIKLPEPHKQPRPITKPIPIEDLEPRLRDTEKFQCGTISFRMAYIEKFIDSELVINPDGSSYFRKISVPGTPSELIETTNKIRTNRAINSGRQPDLVNSFKEAIESAGGSGFTNNIDNGLLKYKSGVGVFQSLQMDGTYYPFQSGNYPILEANYLVVEVPPEGSINVVLDYIKATTPYNLVYDFDASAKKEGCVISQPIPEVIAPPPLAPEKEDCECMCEKVNYPLIKALMLQTLQEQKFTIDVPVVTCEQNQTNEWEPKTSTLALEFFATSTFQALQLAQLHKENAKQASELCLARNGQEGTSEAIASVPLSWQIRHEGGKPQLVIQCAERKEDGKYGSAMYPITVPHWKGGVNDNPSLPPYRKGNYEGILVLADNSKVTINAANQTECSKILNALKPWIPKQMLDGSYFKGGIINTNIKATLVKPMYGRYFPTGQKNSKPEWRVDFP